MVILNVSMNENNNMFIFTSRYLGDALYTVLLNKPIGIYIFFCLLLLLLLFLGPLSRHMEVPRLGVESEL